MPLPRMRESAPDPAVAAEQVIRAHCGWHVAPVIEETLVLDGNGERRLLLPSRRVQDVMGVKVDGAPVDGFRWSKDGWITRDSGVWPDRERSVEVTLRHGFEDASDVLWIAEALRARAAMSPTGHVIAQRAGTQAVTFASAGGAVASLPLLQQEKDALAPYRLNWGP